jgi:hypothetical protein
VLLLLALITGAGGAWAAGPLDGSYAANVTGPDRKPYTLYVVALQNGSGFGAALLDPDLGSWSYVFGTLNAQNRVTGAIIDPLEGIEIGRFEFLFEGSTITGTIAYPGEPPLLLSGPRIF